MERTLLQRLFALVLFLFIVILASTYTIENTNLEPTGDLSNPQAQALDQEQGDTESPVVEWTLPVENTGIYAVGDRPIQVNARASDNVAVVQVTFSRWDTELELYVDVWRDELPPYQGDLDTQTLNYGFNQLIAQASDASGNMSDRAFIWLFRRGPFHYMFLPSVFRK